MDNWIEGNGWPYYQHATSTVRLLACQGWVYLTVYMDDSICSIDSWISNAKDREKMIQPAVFWIPNQMFSVLTILGIGAVALFTFLLCRHSWWLESHHQADRNVHFYRIEPRASCFYDQGVPYIHDFRWVTAFSHFLISFTLSETTVCYPKPKLIMTES